jgi:hypothetical protein
MPELIFIGAAATVAKAAPRRDLQLPMIPLPRQAQRRAAGLSCHYDNMFVALENAGQA